MDDSGFPLFLETSIWIYTVTVMYKLSFINIRFAMVYDPYPPSPRYGLMNKKYGLLWMCWWICLQTCVWKTLGMCPEAKGIGLSIYFTSKNKLTGAWKTQGCWMGCWGLLGSYLLLGSFHIIPYHSQNVKRTVPVKREQQLQMTRPVSLLFPGHGFDSHVRKG